MSSISIRSLDRSVLLLIDWAPGLTTASPEAEFIACGRSLPLVRYGVGVQ